MLRFHKFTIGKAWVTDYGDIDDETQFKYFLTYSPLHNVRAPTNEGDQYPPTLILTANHDDRVSPLHSFKFCAELQNKVQENTFQKNPILLRVYDNSGHGFGKPTEKKIQEAADILTFFSKFLKVGDIQD